MTVTREKPCRRCSVAMPMPPSSRRVYCADCRRTRDNEKTRTLRAKRRVTIDPHASWHGTVHGYTNYACHCEPCRLANRVYVNEWRSRPEVAARRRAQARINSKTPVQRLRRKATQYGVDPELLGSYLGDRVCFACGATDVDLNVDHDHSCCPSSRKVCGGCVRGLLCAKCNLTLGIVGDSLDRLRHLIAYLERWDAKRG